MGGVVPRTDSFARTVKLFGMKGSGKENIVGFLFYLHDKDHFNFSGGREEGGIV